MSSRNTLLHGLEMFAGDLGISKPSQVDIYN